MTERSEHLEIALEVLSSPWCEEGPHVVAADAVRELIAERDRLRSELDALYARRRTPTELTEAMRRLPAIRHGGLAFVDRVGASQLINDASEQLQAARR